jgi:hypothetical protein
MRNKWALAVTVILLLIATIVLRAFQASGGDDARLGVFSNHAEGFGVSLVVDKSGRALFASALGVIGEWMYDTNTCILTLNYFDSEAGKDGSVKFRFNQDRRCYTIVGAESSENRVERNTLAFLTNAIPEEWVKAFAKYPETVKEERRRFQADQEAKRLRSAKLAREEPEYQRLLQAIRDHPEIVLSDEKFYSREDTSSTRAFRTALGDKKVHFSEKTLIELLDRLPPDNHWSRAQIFSRPELSSSTIEQFYPKALNWGAYLSYTILANIATHTNTPRRIVEDLASRKGLPVGATGPAQRQLKKLRALENQSIGTNTLQK